jgi:hypothetical protein
MKKGVLALAVVFLLLQAGCSNKSSANFELYMTDAPAYGIEHVYVTIEAIYLRSEDRQTWTDNILSEPKTIDLIALRGREEKLAALELPPGTYSGLKLVISKVEIVTSERTFTMTINPPVTVTIPCQFTVTGQTSVKMTLDFDADRSLLWNGMNYNFAPYIIVKNIVHH